MTFMRLEEVFDRLPELYNRRFSELRAQENIDGFVINKGGTGQFLQRLLGMPNNSDLTDFEDGELKTNKSFQDGKPKETMFITQISRDFDELFFGENLTTNRLFTKISNLLYLPVCKEDANPENWYFLPAYHINTQESEILLNILLQDFLDIRDQILNHLNNQFDGLIHTSSGRYIQVRSKDSRYNGRYNPIYSQRLQRNVSDKNHAFYFKRDFMIDMQRGVIPARKIV